VGICGHKLSPERLPDSLQPNECKRKEWSDADGCCILHTTEKVDDITALESEIRDADRIDGLQLARQQLSEGFTFQEMQIYGGDFQNAKLTECEFIGTEIMHSRFEGAILDHATFKHENQSESNEDQSSITNTRTNLRHNSFENANLTGTSFRRNSFLNTEFDCEKLQSVEFIDCSLPNVSFKNQDFYDAEFSYSLLRETAFDGCDFHNVDFHATVLKETKFINSNLRKTDFRNAVLDETEFHDVKVDHRTKFDTLLVQEYLADRYSERVLSADEIKDPHEYLHSQRERIPIPFAEMVSEMGHLRRLWFAVKRFSSRHPRKEGEPDYSLLEHARYRYRDLSRVFGENDEPERSREYTVREKHTKRKNALRNDEASWLWLSFTRWTMQYGEKPVQPLKAALGVILISALLYPVFGITYVDSDHLISYCLSCQPSLEAFFSVVHLSITRLLAPTNPGIEPIGLGVIVGLFESIIGALLAAMFVFTLGRRATE